MPRKYLRITRRRTCVTPEVQEEEKMIQRRSIGPPHLFAKRPLLTAAVLVILPEDPGRGWFCRSRQECS